MKLRTILGLFALAAACYTMGCIPHPDPDIPVDPTNTTYVVAIGMETSNFAGNCPGAGVDCERMTEVFKKYTPNVKTFISGQAKKAAIVQTMIDYVQKAELFILYYSGHGGSEKMKDIAPEEIDGNDEFLCLNDTYMVDDEIWNIISMCKGRVLLIFDCCHSCTLYRCPGFTLKRAIPLSAIHNEEGSLKMCCWSGCPDDKFSYGDRNGGLFTNALLKYFKQDMCQSYSELWRQIEDDSYLKSAEEVQCTLMGGFDTDKQVFK